MKNNKLKILSISTCCLFSVLWLDARCMEEQRRNDEPTRNISNHQGKCRYFNGNPNSCRHGNSCKFSHSKFAQQPQRTHKKYGQRKETPEEYRVRHEEKLERTRKYAKSLGIEIEHKYESFLFCDYKIYDNESNIIRLNPNISIFDNESNIIINPNISVFDNKSDITINKNTLIYDNNKNFWDKKIKDDSIVLYKTLDELNKEIKKKIKQIQEEEKYYEEDEEIIIKPAASYGCFHKSLGEVEGIIKKKEPPQPSYFGWGRRQNSLSGRDGGSDERDLLIDTLEMSQLDNETEKKYGMTYDERCKFIKKYGKEPS